MHLRPIRQSLALMMWTRLILYPLGYLVVWPTVEQKTASLVGFAITAALFGLLSWFVWHGMLKRVVAAPSDAVVGPGYISAGRIAASVGIPIVLVVVCLLGFQGSYNFGIGFGGALGSAWAVRRIGQFERDDGRCLAREKAGVWDKSGSPLYAASR